ncbi:MAG: methylmalonyl-CoA mutase, partial [Promethearchaeota archaeon]
MGADKAKKEDAHETPNPDLSDIQAAKDRWEAGTLSRHVEKHPERREEFISTSSRPVRRIYTPLDIPK